MVGFKNIHPTYIHKQNIIHSSVLLSNNIKMNITTQFFEFVHMYHLIPLLQMKGNRVSKTVMLEVTTSATPSSKSRGDKNIILLLIIFFHSFFLLFRCSVGDQSSFIRPGGFTTPGLGDSNLELV